MRVRMFWCSVGSDERTEEGDFELSDVLINNLDGCEPLELAEFITDLEEHGKATLAGGTGVYAEFERIAA
ncbi:hypothetical protein HJA82_29685 [Rhizobium bangladeshense]|uniref:hypothetical protein n=1 Tax=Rhizobium bangladeshense TaxID=1138189 RepID=UPI001C836A8C|nr:hypothetical protein [Rhizobium bangladeshense]MBX4911489.1 hypothetical protein [Rhizobium bangladeshense]